VRTANAFNVSMVHIIGKRDWNKRGAMVTDRYLTVMHHPTIADFAAWCKENQVPIIGIDNVPSSKHLEGAALPEKCVLLFGQEGAGMSDEGIEVCEVLYAIEQYGSTRSMNASAAGAIAMYHWALQHLPRKS
jgi:tRNA G18 (ribose-2'-O)-methylase SpoU